MIGTVALFRSWAARRGLVTTGLADADVTYLLTAASEQLAELCYRKLEADDTSTESKIWGNGQTTLLIPESVSVSKVEEGDTELTVDVDYETVHMGMLPIWGLRKLPYGELWAAGIVYTVTSVLGYCADADMPATLTDAVYSLAAMNSIAANDDGVKSVTVQGVSTSLKTYDERLDELKTLIMAHIKAI